MLPHRRTRVLSAGERHQGRGGRRTRGRFHLGGVLRFVRNVVAVLVVVGGALYGVAPPVRSAVNTEVSSVYQSITRLVNPTYDRLPASSVTASSFVAGHPPTNAVDLIKGTSWLANVATDPQPSLTLRFSQPSNVDAIIITPGDQDTSTSFAEQPQPTSIHVVFSNGSTQDFTLLDKPAQQTFDLSGGDGVTSMTITITAHESPVAGTAGAGTLLGFDEVELFTEK